MHLIRRLMFCVACLISGICLGETSPMTATEIVIPHVKIKNATFRDALSSVKVYLENAHLRMVDDTVNDVPADYDSPRIFNFEKKNITIGHLLTSFCSYYGLQWSTAGDAVTISLPRPK
jgi:hypothetical protein